MGRLTQAQEFVAGDRRAMLSSPEGMGALRDTLVALDSELGVLAREGEVFLNLSAFLGWVPRYGYDIQAAPQLLAMAQETIAAGIILCEIGQDALQRTGTDQDQMSALLEVTQDHKDRFALARETLGRALDIRAEVDALRLSEKTVDHLAQFDRLTQMLTVGLRAAALGPYLLGSDAPRVYLILAQNEDELRPTGGFISAAGHVSVDNGHITELDMADSYTFDNFSNDYPWPPYPLYEYMGADYWLLRDANWSPDFPISAEVAAGMFLLDTGIDVDGVLAIDQTGLEYVLEGLGSVEVPTEAGGVWVTADNLTLWMQSNWAPAPGQAQDGEWWVGRKSFIVDLAVAMLNRAEDGREINQVALLKAILRALEEKHLQVYNREPGAAELLADLGWDGHVDRSPGDYFMAVEANVSFNKASALIERGLDYRVALDSDGGGGVTVELHYQHQSENPVDFCDPTSRYDAVYSAMMDRCYWNYLRLIVPAGAELSGYPRVVVPGAYLLRGRPSDDEVEVETINDVRKSWGQLFLLAPGDSATLKYTYQIPEGTALRLKDHWQYRLLLQKQPGIRTLPVSLNVRLPDRMGLLGSDPQPSLIEGQMLHYDLNLSGDQPVRIDYGP